MTVVANRRLLDAAVVAMLATATSEMVNLCAPPDAPSVDADGLLVDPYTIVYPVAGPATEGDFARGSIAMRPEYQLTSVGRNAEHAQWMADKCRQAFLVRNGNGTFTNPITPADAVVLDRWPMEVGAAEPSGDALYQVVDTYQMEVCSA